MIRKVKEIVSAWIIANDPTEEQKVLAENRFKICNECTHLKTLSEKIKISTICGKCGCPISKKLFSNEFNACPLKKWNDVDNIFFPNTQKRDKTIL
jgi:bacterioferritin-associated ferredoxin